MTAPMTNDAPQTLAQAHKAAREGARRCIVTGHAQDRMGLLRFVVGPDGQVVPDIHERLPGRGLWVGARRSLVDQAAAKGLFSRAARAKVVADVQLGALAGELLWRAARDALGLARRAGQMRAGHDQVQEAAERGSVVAFLTARDAGREGQEAAQAWARRAPQARRIAVFDRATLGAAFGRDQIVHAALLPGPMAARFLAALERAQTYDEEIGRD